MTPEEETYEDVKRLLWKLCHRHACPCCAFDEKLSAAHAAFCRAYRKYRAYQQIEFSTYLARAVMSALIDQCKRGRRYLLLPTDGESLQQLSRLELFPEYRDLSQDAQQIVEMFRYEPRKYNRQRGKSARRRISADLKESGWSIARVSLAFGELREFVNEET